MEENNGEEGEGAEGEVSTDVNEDITKEGAEVLAIGKNKTHKLSVKVLLRKSCLVCV